MASDMHAFVEDFRGSWNIQEIDPPAPGRDKPIIGNGTETWELETAGVPFIEHYRVNRNGREESDIGYFWWNSVPRKIEGLFRRPRQRAGLQQLLRRTPAARPR